MNTIMKKLLLIFAVFAWITFESNAQNISRDDVAAGFGVRGGLNFYNFGGADAGGNDFTNRIGYHAGVFTNLFLGERIAIEPGAYYSVKGTQNQDIANTRAVLNYVEVPLLVRLYVFDGLNIFAGPQASFLLNSRFEGDVLGGTIGTNTESVASTDLGVVAGIGYNLVQGINLQASYEHGTSRVFRTGNADIYNRGFKLSLGFAL
jgi:hypothetical protein